jgi:hypothetical protein
MTQRHSTTVREKLDHTSLGAEEGVDRVFELAAGREANTGAQLELVSAVEDRVNGDQARNIDDAAAMDAGEAARIEF